MQATGELGDTWIVARTKPLQEQYARENIERQGHQTYLPLFLDRSNRIKALFPGYLFVKHPDCWSWLRSTYGVLDVVFGSEGRPARLRGRYVTELRQREGHNGLIVINGERFHNGQCVRLNSGPFEGFLGRYVRMSGTDRVKVLLQLLGGETLVEIAEDKLELA